MTKVMFLCTGNSCCSQMAEGFAREFGKDIIEAHSAGLNPAGLNERAVKVMREIGIDISQQKSKTINGYYELPKTMDIVIILCGDAAEFRPWLSPETKCIHWPLPDPAAFYLNDTDKLQLLRNVREQIKELIENLIKEVQHG